MVPLGLESPGFESFTLSSCETLNEAPREFSLPISPLQIITASCKWVEEYPGPGSRQVLREHCSPDPAASPTALTSSPETQQEGHLLPYSHCENELPSSRRGRQLGRAVPSVEKVTHTGVLQGGLGVVNMGGGPSFCVPCRSRRCSLLIEPELTDPVAELPGLVQGPSPRSELPSRAL